MFFRKFVDPKSHLWLKVRASCAGGGGRGQCSPVPTKCFSCSLVPVEYFFDLSIPCSLKYAFVPVLPVVYIYSIYSHVNGYVPMFPESPRG